MARVFGIVHLRLPDQQEGRLDREISRHHEEETISVYQGAGEFRGLYVFYGRRGIFLKQFVFAVNRISAVERTSGSGGANLDASEELKDLWGIFHGAG
jgi:hypothetical protein